ncbi:SPRY domain-containing protein [Paenibacillus sp. 1781tsa1]|uniref:SPRY domain-containing protein n=1 Tax=Paenibacillus sp. 1781tsa1 TaxID=2953810 RepID=UPI0020A0A4DF|nr:SPRY domain-containing protein [Paenibacillus sp. 1781tsa1]MCP1185118.1 SPRY domain-containing protein [Paenibacillus sp. 1781tsa1]
MAVINVTLNPNDAGTGHLLSTDNLTDTVTAGSNIRATHSKTAGKWYWEIKYVSGNAALAMGIADIRYPISSAVWNTNSGDGIYLRGYYGINGPRIPENTAYGSTWAINDVIGVALDLDNGTLEFYKNGASMGVSHTNLKSLGTVFPFFRSINTTSKTFTVNFGASPFSYSIPTGYQAYANVSANKILLSSGNGVYSLKESVAYKLNIDSEKNFLSYGADSITSFNGSLTKKRNIKNTSAVLGSGKTFEHTVDMSKRRVDKITLG